MLELAAELADSEPEGKTRFGQRRRVVCRALLVGLGCQSWVEFFQAQTSQSFFSLLHSALVPEPRREIKLEAAAWPGCGGAGVLVVFCGGFVSLFWGDFLLLWSVRDW
ncbi:hypothetical protein Taro_053901 [Colocasia esculenta]|uniref:Uncharacterized protein n=1 Tax=Colocasia esculenta TaxID=4460 RepID=A0A843XNZ9_COLES|nr:hypothetical protein [Colocasia esculenta]